jgi:hypothetical protein
MPNIEYRETKHTPSLQYEHHTWLVAEDITSCEVIIVSLFNGTVPLTAIQIGAYKDGKYGTSVFTKVVDKTQCRWIDQDQKIFSVHIDRAYWAKEKGTTGIGGSCSNG